MGSREKSVLGGHERVRVAIGQVSPVFLDLDATVERAVETIEAAATGGADLLVFPEAWLAGYPYWTEGWDTELPRFAAARTTFRDAAVSVTGPAVARIAEAAGRAGIHVALGCNEIDDAAGINTIYNTLLFIDRAGNLRGRHRKLMPTFTERMYWGRGDACDLGIIETDIGAVGGLICGEHLMPAVRGAMIGFGEELHVALFPGSFALHTGPRLEEPDTAGDFWGHASVRNHAFEAGAFVLSACAYVDPAEVAADFPFADDMNLAYAHGGSSVVGPLGVPLVPPTYGSQLIFADCEAWMIKVVKAIVDTAGHYARPDVLRLQLRTDAGWEDVVGGRLLEQVTTDRAGLRRNARENGVDPELVEATVADLAER